MYEWDEKKRLSNIKKHSLDFVDAVMVFEDANRLVYEDKRKDYSETRYRTIGSLKGIVIIVIVYTDRTSKTRIISARVANKKERVIYEKQ